MKPYAVVLFAIMSIIILYLLLTVCYFSQQLNRLQIEAVNFGYAKWVPIEKTPTENRFEWNYLYHIGNGENKK